jgi:hypothetical protein
LSGLLPSLSMEGRRRSQHGAVGLALVAAALLAPRIAAAQDCPTAKTAKHGFVVERNERQKSDVFHDDQGIVRTVMRYDGTTMLETTQFEGLFQPGQSGEEVRDKVVRC